MIIEKRNRHHIRQLTSGSVLVGDSGPNGPTFPPADFYFGSPPGEALIGPIGEIYTYTIVHGSNAPSYALAMVDFPQDVRVFGRVVGDASRVQIGARATVVPFPRADGEDDYAFSVEEGR
ncbi:hypothetical protein UB46_17255 [Burkholderiaceae bacterium 16]|nr:hypothetical protein UB46_17255 [Burkholderiaceae bacterium 16]